MNPRSSLVCSSIRVVYVVQLYVILFLAPRCAVRYNICVEMMPCLSLLR